MAKIDPVHKNYHILVNSEMNYLLQKGYAKKPQALSRIVGRRLTAMMDTVARSFRSSRTPIITKVPA